MIYEKREGNRREVGLRDIACAWSDPGQPLRVQFKNRKIARKFTKNIKDHRFYQDAIAGGWYVTYCVDDKTAAWFKRWLQRNLIVRKLPVYEGVER